MGLKRAAAAAAVMIMCALTTSACGSDDDGTSSQTATTQAATSTPAQSSTTALPESIASKGELRNLVNTPNPPMEFAEKAGGAVTGFDVELADALGKQLGIPMKTSQTPDFSSLIPGIQSGRTDIVLSGLSDRKERQKLVSFVDYFKTGNQFLIRQSDAAKFKTNADLCGQSVVASTGTSYPDVVKALSKEVCESAGRPAMKIVQVASLPDQLLQLKTGRAVAIMLSTEVIGYQIQQNKGQYAALADPINPGLYGIIYPKDQPELGAALQKALDELIANGTYKQLLDKWGLGSSAVTKATINAGTAE
jgi:polar amino acid transport system substrate-binding protein